VGSGRDDFDACTGWGDCSGFHLQKLSAKVVKKRKNNGAVFNADYSTNFTR